MFFPYFLICLNFSMTLLMAFLPCTIISFYVAIYKLVPSFIASGVKVNQKGFHQTKIIFLIPFTASSSILWFHLQSFTSLFQESILVYDMRYESDLFPSGLPICPINIYCMIQPVLTDLKCHLYLMLSSHMYWVYGLNCLLYCSVSSGTNNMLF